MKSKYLTLGLVILLTSIVVVSGCIGQSSEPAVTLNQNTEKFSTYEDSNYGVKISYPEEWTSKESDAIFVFSSSRGESINLFIQDLGYSGQDITLDEYTESVKEGISLYSIDTIPPSPEKTTISGLPAYLVTYTARLGNIELKTTQAWVVKDNKAYMLTYAGPVKDFDKSLGSRIIHSFEITEKAVKLNL